MFFLSAKRTLSLALLLGISPVASAQDFGRMTSSLVERTKQQVKTSVPPRTRIGSSSPSSSGGNFASSGIRFDAGGNRGQGSVDRNGAQGSYADSQGNHGQGSVNRNAVQGSYADSQGNRGQGSVNRNGAQGSYADSQGNSGQGYMNSNSGRFGYRGSDGSRATGGYEYGRGQTVVGGSYYDKNGYGGGGSYANDGHGTTVNGYYKGKGPIVGTTQDYNGSVNFRGGDSNASGGTSIYDPTGRIRFGGSHGSLSGRGYQQRTDGGFGSASGSTLTTVGFSGVNSTIGYGQVGKLNGVGGYNASVYGNRNGIQAGGNINILGNKLDGRASIDSNGVIVKTSIPTPKLPSLPAPKIEAPKISVPSVSVGGVKSPR